MIRAKACLFALGIVAAVSLGATTAPSVDSTEAVLAKFRLWRYECAKYPEAADVKALDAIPDDAASGEALYWKSKVKLRAVADNPKLDDVKEARVAVFRAAKLGYAPAEAEVCRIGLFEKQYKDLQTRDATIRRLMDLTRINVPDAAIVLGKMFEDGAADMKVDLKNAELYYQVAIKFGDRRAWGYLAIAQKKNGKRELAISSLTTGADAGDPQAAYMLARWYDDSMVVAQDPAKAEEYYHKAADRELPAAQLALAKKEQARGNAAAAHDWAEKAAASGMPEAVAFRDELRRQRQ